MIQILSGCVSLFNSTFNAAVTLDFFQILLAVIILQVILGIYCAMSHRLRKM